MLVYILLEMGLSTFNGPFIIWNSFINFMSNEFNPPSIMPHVVFKMHLVTPLCHSFTTLQLPSTLYQVH